MRVLGSPVDAGEEGSGAVGEVALAAPAGLALEVVGAPTPVAKAVAVGLALEGGGALGAGADGVVHCVPIGAFDARTADVDRVRAASSAAILTIGALIVCGAQTAGCAAGIPGNTCAHRMDEGLIEPVVVAAGVARCADLIPAVGVVRIMLSFTEVWLSAVNGCVLADNSVAVVGVVAQAVMEALAGIEAL